MFNSSHYLKLHETEKGEKSVFSMGNPLESDEEKFSTVRSLLSLNQ